MVNYIIIFKNVTDCEDDDFVSDAFASTSMIPQTHQFHDDISIDIETEVGSDGKL